jgi:hypothetical protein
VTLPPRGDGIAYDREYDRYSLRILQQRAHRGGAEGQHDVWPQRDQLRRVAADVTLGRSCEADLDPRVAAVGPPRLLQCHHEGADQCPCMRIVFDERYENPDAPHAVALLRPRHARPRPRRAAEQGDELAPPYHSMTSSARTSTISGTARPSAFAVFRFRTVSYFPGTCTGKLAGFSPRRMRST